MTTTIHKPEHCANRAPNALRFAYEHLAAENGCPHLQDREFGAGCRSRTDLTTSGASDVDVDPHRLHQVVANLVANALNQMPDGEVLEVTVVGTTITVANTGPGLAENQSETVFERFQKSSDSKGSDLGLSIARDLVEAHGGTLTAVNRPAGGAVFEIQLPESS